MFTSSYTYIWSINSFGVFDYDQLNSVRLNSNHAVDIRIDKKWFWKKVTLNIYLDIQNLYNFQAELPPSWVAATDLEGNKLTLPSNPNQPDRYQLERIENNAGTILPSVGLQFEF